MTAKEFIQKRLKNLRIAETEKSVRLSPNDLADFIYKAVLNKKFRKFKVTPEYLPHIREAVTANIRAGSPIKFAFPFGAYKLWRLEESPEADWAELFTLMYYAKWLAPIAAVYPPGVWFDFSSDEVIVERMNNIPEADTQKYAQSFHRVIDFLSQYLPENFRFTLTPVRSLYTPDEFEADLKEQISAMEKRLGGLPVLADDAKRSIELNVRIKPGQDKDPLWREKVELIHQSYYLVSRRRPYTRAKDKILTFCVNMDNCVPVGTTKTSVAKFWAGAGALKPVGPEFIEYVLSPSQLRNAKFIWQDLRLPGLDGKNFERVRILSSDEKQ